MPRMSRDNHLGTEFEWPRYIGPSSKEDGPHHLPKGTTHKTADLGRCTSKTRDKVISEGTASSSLLFHRRVDHSLLTEASKVDIDLNTDASDDRSSWERAKDPLCILSD